ncbi:MAG: prephenate dehydrogenase/arogenate dehydrogenase family protein [Eggerthellaceae bacterium]|jgi:prephenate dehydrogenase
MTQKLAYQNDQPAFQHLAVVGLGLIGASLASAIKQSWPQVEIFGVDLNKRSCVVAQEQSWVDETSAPDDSRFDEFLKTTCDACILAIPAHGASYYFEKLTDLDFRGLVTDTASTKQVICAAAQELFRYPENYIPGHPMAGSEKNGIDGARSDLFQGAHWILCPDEQTNPEYFQKLHEFITGIGARMVSLPREKHDSAVAIVSHVPHIVASSLVKLMFNHADDQESLYRLAAGGFKDTTRIAAGSPQLWTGIAFDNSAALHDGLLEMQDIIGSFVKSLETDDRENMKELLEEAASLRRSLPAAWVPSTDRLLEVRIPMENRKGVVAEVTTIASSVGCNIQSIEIDHITAESAVLSLILTDEGDIGKLSARLIDSGFSVSFSPLASREMES